MIIAVKDITESSRQMQFDIQDDRVCICGQDLSDDSIPSLYVEANKHDFLKAIRAMNFSEQKYGSGEISDVSMAIKDLLREYGFTTPIINDDIAYNAFAMKMIELMEAVKSGTFGYDFHPVECDPELTEVINKSEVK